MSHVSLWAGQMQSKRALENYLKQKYTPDGEAIPSAFEKEFSLDFIDEDFLESNFLKKPASSIAAALKGHSYDSEIIASAIKKFGENFPKPVNTVILLYNVDYSRQKLPRKTDLHSMQFIGTVAYE